MHAGAGRVDNACARVGPLRVARRRGAHKLGREVQPLLRVQRIQTLDDDPGKTLSATHPCSFQCSIHHSARSCCKSDNMRSI
jgi:hypothetical protein